MSEATYAQRFVDYLVGLEAAENRAALAALRRGAGKPPGTTPEMFPIMVPWTSTLPTTEADHYYLIGALFALHPSNTDGGNLGTTLRAVAGGDGAAMESTQRRFMVLLNTGADDLHYHLRQAVSLARSKDVPINWVRLLGDLRSWDHPDRYIQRQWAEKFWVARSGDAGADS